MSGGARTSVGRCRGLRWPLLLFAALAIATPLRAQATAPAGSAAEPGAPAWTVRWSPLRPLADLRRTLPGGEAIFPELLTLPTPRLGQFWTVGNPAGLPLELRDGRVAFRAGATGVSGDYRRPLDPGTERRLRISGLGWGRLGERGAAIGRVLVERTGLEDGAHADVLSPYATNPFAAVLDTVGDALNRTAARLEGAGGWTAGPLALGLGFAYEAQETRTRETTVPRTNRSARPGVTAGAVLEVPGSALRLGAFGRWHQTAESVDIFAVAGNSRVYALQGYTDPVAINLSSTLFDRRIERRSRALGASASGRAGGLSWTAYGQLEAGSAERFDDGQSDPLQDTWEADGWTVGAAGQLPLGAAWMVTADARYTTLAGDGSRADLEAVTFRAHEERLLVSGDIRLLPGGRWEAAARASLKRESRTRTDLIAGARSEVESWRPAVAVEVAHHLAYGLSASLGGAFSQHAPTASTPDPATLGPVFAKWIAPELDVAASEAAAWAGTATVRAAVASGTGVWLRGRVGSAGATEGTGLPTSLASGDRTAWAVTMGVVLGGR